MKENIFIVGAGVIGQTTGKSLSGKGFRVTFIDTDPEVVNELREEGYRAVGTTDQDNREDGIFMISVPTYAALSARNDGLESIRMAAASVGEWLSGTNEYSLVVVRSTVIPGTTEEVVVPIIEKCSGKSAGRDFGVCVNPEYLRQHNAQEDYNNPWIVIIGELDSRSGELLQGVYSWADCPIYRIALKEAELHKCIHNLSNASKISFFNEMRLVCQQIGLDGDKVFPLVTQSAESLWNPQYGTANLGPFGGKCLPKDIAAFLSWAKEQSIETPMVEAALKINKIFERQQLSLAKFFPDFSEPV